MVANNQIWPPDDGQQLLKGRNSHMPSLTLWSFSFRVDVIRYRQRPHVFRYFWIRNFFFPDSKISTSARIRMQIEFARPHVSDTYRSHVSGFTLVPRNSLWEYWQQSMRRKAREICILLCLSRWRTGLDLVTSPDKKKISGFSVYTIAD